MPSPAIVLRPLSAADLDTCHALSVAVGWAHRLADWRWVAGFGRGVVAEMECEIVGTTLWWLYGETASSIGMVIVRPDRQGFGIGRRLVEAALADLGDRTAVLVATDAGEPLYARLGFADTGRVLQQQGIARAPDLPPASLRPLRPADIEAVIALDHGAKGMRRAAAIAALAEAGDGMVLTEGAGITGFGFCREAGLGRVIGPVVAPDAAGARALIGHWLARHAGTALRVDTSADSGIGDWLAAHGLALAGTGIAMTRGRRPPVTAGARSFALINQGLG